MTDSDQRARRNLGRLNKEVVPLVKKNREIAHEFIDEVIERLPTGLVRYELSPIHCGSAYEGLAVEVNTDFDIVLMLNSPFETYNFEIRRDLSGYFTFQWKSHIRNKLASDGEGFLNAAAMKSDLFSSISSGMKKCSVPEAKIYRKRKLVAVNAKIKYRNGRTVKIDVVPQIVCRTWGQCPDLRPLRELPKCLREYIDKLNKNKSPVMSFSLAVPDANKYPNKDRLLSVSFGLLEKEFLASHVNIRDMVRLVKLVALERNWKEEYKFRPLFVKRIAVKHCDELKDKDMWEGRQAILSYLAQEVERGSVDEFFIKGKEIYTWEPDTADDFLQEIAEVMEEE